MDAPVDFPVLAGRFVSVALPLGPLARRVVRAVGEVALPEAVGVYLRGSAIERLEPHPRADIDLVAVGPADLHEAVSAALRAALQPEGRPIEVATLTPEAFAVDPVTRVLVGTRAMCIAGPPLEVPAVPAADATVRAFWARYAAFLVFPRPGTSVMRRVCELKQLTRSFGVVRWFLDGLFTRDVEASLAFADAWAPRSASILRAAWRAVEEAPDDPVGALDADAVRAPLVDFVRAMHAAGRW